MDQYLSTVIISIITGIFSLITLLIQKKQDKVISKIDNQTVFIEREKMLKQKLLKKQADISQLLNFGKKGKVLQEKILRNAVYLILRLL